MRIGPTIITSLRSTSLQSTPAVVPRGENGILEAGQSRNGSIWRPCSGPDKFPLSLRGRGFETVPENPENRSSGK